MTRVSIMSLAVALGATISAASAWAHPIVPANERATSPSSMSRQQVTGGLEEAVRSRAAPVAMPADLYPAATIGSGRTRDEVTRELSEALRDGTAPIARIAYPGPSPTTGSAPKTRDEVLHELEHFKADPSSGDGWMFVGGDVGWVPAR